MAGDGDREEHSMKFEKLLEPGRIGTVEIRNRMVQPAMGTNYSSADGFVTDQLVNYIARRAEGGVGLIITEIVLVDPKGRVIPGELDLSKDVYIPGMARLVNAAHAGGAKIFCQFAHGGCFAGKATSGVEPATPSGIATFQLDFEPCHVMTINEIHKLIDDYVAAVVRAKKAGFDGVEIHCAHGYMPLQFLSPYTNRRTDEYGGSLENRARFSLEILRKAKAAVGRKFPITFRLSAEEYTIPQGVTLEEACRFAEMLEKEGCDAIHVTAGTWDSRYQYFEGIKNGSLKPEDYDTSIGVGCGAWIPPYFTPRGVLIPLAAEVKKHVSIPVITVNSISPELGEQALREGKADFVAIGRQSFADPDYPKKVAAQHPEDIRRCLRCNECHSSLVAPFGVQCSVNPQTGKEGEMFTQIRPAEHVKKVAVIGGGPSGMVAALVASQRGHRVTLFEKKERLGGDLYYASIPSFKEDFRAYLQYLRTQIGKSRVEVRMNTEATADLLVKEGFETVLVATGATTFRPSFAATTGIYDPLKVLDGDIPEGKNILVCGAGLVGCEVSLFLTEHGKHVTMIDMAKVAGPESAFYLRYSLWAKLIEAHVDEKMNHSILAIEKDHVDCRFEDKPVTYTGDAVICALGLKSDRKLLEELRSAHTSLEIIPIGDVNRPRKILQAVHEGYHAGRRI